MKRKIFILISILIIASLAFAACGNNVGNNLENNGNNVSDVDLNNNEDDSSDSLSQFVEYGVAGYIMELDLIDDSDIIGRIYVEGPENNGAEHKKAYVDIYKDTKIYVNETNDFDSLKVGMYVEIFFDGPVRESYPVQADAKQINVIPESPRIEDED